MKLTNKEKADIVFLRGTGYTNSQIAEKLDISVSTVEYQLRRIRERAEEVGPLWTFIETVLAAGPDYPLFRFAAPFGVRPEEVRKRWEGGER